MAESEITFQVKESPEGGYEAVPWATASLPRGMTGSI